ncbi:MAG: VanZ family protein [Planctomycetota bacterium]
MNRRVHIIFDVLTLACYFIFLYITLCTPTPAGVKILLFPYSDKILHACQFAGFSLIICRFLWNYFPSIGRYWILFISISVAVICGGTSEFIQMSVPGRFADIGDAVSDAVGALIAAFVWNFILLKNTDSSKIVETPVID